MNEELQREIRRIVGEACGAVSMCWDPRPSGVFDSSPAAEYVDAALVEINELLDAHLGTGAS